MLKTIEFKEQNNDKFNDMFISDKKIIKRLYAFLDVDKSSVDNLVFDIPSNFKQVLKSDDYFELYKSSCVYPEKNYKEVESLKQLFKTLDEQKTALRRENLAKKLYKSNIESLDAVHVSNFEKIIKELQNESEKIKKKIECLTDENKILVNQALESMR